MELVWVLMGCYALTRSEICEVLETLLRTKGIIVAHADTVWKALVRPEKSLLFLFHRRNYDLTKPVVPSTVPYPDMRSWQQLGVKLWGQCNRQLIRYANPRGEAKSASTKVERC